MAWKLMTTTMLLSNCSTRYFKRRKFDLVRQPVTTLTLGLLMVTSMLIHWHNMFLKTTLPCPLLKVQLCKVMKMLSSTFNCHMIWILQLTLKSGTVAFTLYHTTGPSNTLCLMQRTSRIY